MRTRKVSAHNTHAHTSASPPAAATSSSTSHAAGQEIWFKCMLMPTRIALLPCKEAPCVEGHTSQLTRTKEERVGKRGVWRDARFLSDPLGARKYPLSCMCYTYILFSTPLGTLPGQGLTPSFPSQSINSPLLGAMKPCPLPLPTTHRACTERCETPAL